MCMVVPRGTRLILLAVFFLPVSNALLDYGSRLHTLGRESQMPNWRHNLRHLLQYSFRDFVQDYNRTYTPKTQEWDFRKNLFDRRLKEVTSFLQTKASSPWKKGVTKFMDYTDREFKMLLGYKGRRTIRSNLLDTEHHKFVQHHPLPGKKETRALSQQNQKLVTVLNHKSALNMVIRDQGSCGSCWAVAAVAVLESHVELNASIYKTLRDHSLSVSPQQTEPVLSAEAAVACTPNPRHCGGTGGCGGATAELAYDFIKDKGLPLAVHWPYTSGTRGEPDECLDSKFAEGMPRLGITGYTTLPMNKLDPLKQALAESGTPIAVTVDATEWAYYSEGIFTDMSDGAGDFTVNHAVTLVGYQEPDKGKMGFWHIKNSWGPTWGEGGFIRLEMKANEEQHCGWDYKPKDGIACDGDPDVAWVCGTCGVLYDSSFPLGVHIRGI